MTNKIEEETLDLMDFCRALGWSGELTIFKKYSKKYGEFFTHSSIGGKIYRVYVDTFIERKGLGLVLSAKPSELNRDRPDICCRNKGSRVCMEISMRHRIREALEIQQENFGYLAAPHLYRRILETWDSCCLLDYSVFNYILFTLVEDRVIEYQKSDFGTNLYRLTSIPIKRRPGRPPINNLII
jgi:hypothetical protein